MCHNRSRSGRLQPDSSSVQQVYVNRGWFRAGSSLKNCPAAFSQGCSWQAESPSAFLSGGPGYTRLRSITISIVGIAGASCGTCRCAKNAGRCMYPSCSSQNARLAGQWELLDPLVFVIGLTSLCEPSHSYLELACGIKAHGGQRGTLADGRHR
jgi:hypothetical protein